MDQAQGEQFKKHTHTHGPMQTANRENERAKENLPMLTSSAGIEYLNSEKIRIIF